ncbi:hypothetical protein OUZ56_004640 [Daphnia magna]|uniref:Secreted protein n=1 Tax=Daphnia magna TaxID=35525 RepID=A0ABQ9YQE5_9CRUS|nr:hypothetical protein OUZ56_004640 [Daphnia magna]
MHQQPVGRSTALIFFSIVGLPFKSLPIPRHPHCGAILSLSLPCFPLFVRVCTEYMVGRCGRLRFSRVPTFSQSTPVTELCARPVHRYAPDHRPGLKFEINFQLVSFENPT